MSNPSPNPTLNQNQSAMSLAMRGASVASPGQSSPESLDIEDDSSAAWQTHGQTSPSSQSAPHGPTPLQKRRRVTRACDECRRKKIKCDGKQPCTHCTVYSYDCTYDQPSNRRRNPAPQYIEALETRLQRAEALLKTVLPNIDLSDPDVDSIFQQRLSLYQPANLPPNNVKEAQGSDPASNTDQDGQLQSMIESTGQLDLDEAGHWDFHGGSSGAVWIKRMREQFGGLLGNDSPGGSFLPKLPRPSAMSPIYDSPKSSTESPREAGLPNTMELPSRETAKILCENSLSRACSLLRFVHQPSFYEMVDRIYDTPPNSFGHDEHLFLPLLYAVLALGCMFSSDSQDMSIEPSRHTYKSSIDQGVKYFRAARHMMDITDCRDIPSLQAVLFMIMFLQASANLSTCYSYIGIGLRSALRMGLHRNLAGNFNPIERETRRRVFWVIRKMDTYVSALLGFPQMLSYDDIDQELPLEVDDEYITKDAVLPMPEGTISLLYAASNAHTRLMATLSKAIKYIYPTKGLEQIATTGAKSSYLISHAKIKEIERDLAKWLDELPMGLRPGAENKPEVLRVQQLLRLAYAHVQMMLYRPFLHYVSSKSRATKPVDERCYACAAACVSVSRNIVHITTEMKRRGLLVGAYWFTMYTTFFAILSLVYFVLENPDKYGSQEILSDANDGKDALNGLAKRSQAADRCSMTLKTLFDQLPDKLKSCPPTPVVSKKKRSAPSSASNEPRTSQNSPELSHLGPGKIPLSRATTFPVVSPLQTAGLQRPSLDNIRYQNNRMSNPNLRHSYHEIMSPHEHSAAGTPDSTTTSASVRPSRYPVEPQFGNNSSVPDLSAMMFPSSDPFAYPNQPMMEFDSVKQENADSANGSQPQPMYPSNGPSGGRVYDDLEGQLFGPLPPYLTHGQNYDMQNQMDTSGSNYGGLNPPDMGYHTGVTPNGNDMTGNFDGIFSGEGDGWNNMLGDQRYQM